MKLESPAKKGSALESKVGEILAFDMTEWLKIFIKSRGCGEGRTSQCRDASWFVKRHGIVRYI
jgi:hypothetical protein